MSRRCLWWLGIQELLCPQKAAVKCATEGQKQQILRGIPGMEWGAVKTILWIDKATFTVTGSLSSQVYCRLGRNALDPQYTSKFVKHPASLRVWCCFTYDIVAELVMLSANEKVNQNNYWELFIDAFHDSLEQTRVKVTIHASPPIFTFGMGTTQISIQSKSYGQKLRDSCAVVGTRHLCLHLGLQPSSCGQAFHQLTFRTLH